MNRKCRENTAWRTSGGSWSSVTPHLSRTSTAERGRSDVLRRYVLYRNRSILPPPRSLRVCGSVGRCVRMCGVSVCLRVSPLNKHSPPQPIARSLFVCTIVARRGCVREGGWTLESRQEASGRRWHAITPIICTRRRTVSFERLHFPTTILETLERKKARKKIKLIKHN
jgi:hypothetical protein